MRIRISKPKSEQCFYYIYIFWYIMTVILQTNVVKLNVVFWNSINSYLDIFVLFLLLGQIIYFRYFKVYEFVLIAIVTVIMVVIGIYSGSNMLLATWIFIVASKNVAFDYLFQRLFIVHIVLFLLVMSLFATGIISQTIIMRGVKPRFSLGYVHPNSLGISVAFIFILDFARKRKIGWIDYLLALLAVVFIWLVPNSQSSAIMIMILIVMLLLYNFIEKRNTSFKNIFLNICIFVSIAVNVCSIILMVSYGENPKLERLNQLFSGRLWYGHTAYQEFGISLFGRDIFSKLDWMILDNSYMLLIIRYGILAYVLFSLAYIISMLYMKKIDGRFTIIMFAFAVYGCMESNFLSVGGNIFLLFISMLLYKRKSVT